MIYFTAIDFVDYIILDRKKCKNQRLDKKNYIFLVCTTSSTGGNPGTFGHCDAYHNCVSHLQYNPYTGQVSI